MAIRVRRCTWLAALAPLVLAAPAAGASPRLHTGSTRYVRIVHLRDGNLSIALTAQGRKRFKRVLRGYVLDASCTTLAPPVQGFSQGGESSGAEGSSGPGGRVTYHVLLDRHADFCDVGRARQTINRRGQSTRRVPGPTLDSIALTQKGAAYLDEDRVTVRILGVLEAALASAREQSGGRFPTAQKLAAMSGGEVVALAAADSSPPTGVIGFFSDGADRAEAVALSALGQRLFIASDAGVLSTNAGEHLVRMVTNEVG